MARRRSDFDLYARPDDLSAGQDAGTVSALLADLSGLSRGTGDTGAPDIPTLYLLDTAAAAGALLVPEEVGLGTLVLVGAAGLAGGAVLAVAGWNLWNTILGNDGDGDDGDGEVGPVEPGGLPGPGADKRGFQWRTFNPKNPWPSRLPSRKGDEERRTNPTLDPDEELDHIQDQLDATHPTSGDPGDDGSNDFDYNDDPNSGENGSHPNREPPDDADEEYGTTAPTLPGGSGPIDPSTANSIVRMLDTDVISDALTGIKMVRVAVFNGATLAVTAGYFARH